MKNNSDLFKSSTHIFDNGACDTLNASAINEEDKFEKEMKKEGVFKKVVVKMEEEPPGWLMRCGLSVRECLLKMKEEEERENKRRVKKDFFCSNGLFLQLEGLSLHCIWSKQSDLQKTLQISLLVSQKEDIHKKNDNEEHDNQNNDEEERVASLFISVLMESVKLFFQEWFPNLQKTTQFTISGVSSGN